MKQPTTPHEQKNLFLAVLLCAALIVVWQITVEMPKRQKLAAWNALQEQKKQEMLAHTPAAAPESAAEAKPLTRDEAMNQSPRLPISTPKLHGSLALKGLRFNDLTLARYRETAEPGSPEVTLLTPVDAGGHPYFVQAGWTTADKGLRVPGDDTLWKADAPALTPEHPVNLSWDNGQGVTYKIRVSVDADYMFSLEQTVENHTNAPVSVSPYALINRGYEDPKQHIYILHEGPVGLSEGALKEIEYKKLRDDGDQALEKASGWLGFTDKYWLTALVPGEAEFKGKFSYYKVRDTDRYQADYTGARVEIPAGQAHSNSLRFFAGAKEIEALDRYTAGDAQGNIPPVPLFDRAVDFGIFYFLTKPIFLTLNMFYAMLGNFGLAILLLTVLIKLFMFPLANKAYKATSQLRELQPDIMRLREQFGDDKLKMQREVMELYKRSKVNPAAGCLPVLVQIPVFFSLYKVLFVTIEMRHAPFYGWIRDLSAADPSNIFNAFGLIPWVPPSALHLGLLPMLMCASMVIQMRQQPAPPDPTQAKMMKLLPYFFLLFFRTMPSGLLIYWTWSNTISILQQNVITKRYKRTLEKREKGKR